MMLVIALILIFILFVSILLSGTFEEFFLVLISLAGPFIFWATVIFIALLMFRSCS